jgi:hypothetical protein
MTVNIRCVYHNTNTSQYRSPFEPRQSKSNYRALQNGLRFLFLCVVVVAIVTYCHINDLFVVVTEDPIGFCVSQMHSQFIRTIDLYYYKSIQKYKYRDRAYVYDVFICWSCATCS